MKAIEKIKTLESGLLLSELNDTIQIDIMQISTEKWIAKTNNSVYNAIISELRSRLSENNK